MRAGSQLLGAIVLASVTYFSILRIAEAKCDAALGSPGYVLDETHSEDVTRFLRLLDVLRGLDQRAFATRLDDLRVKKQIWIAPGLDANRWAVYVEALGLVKRIYVRRIALHDPGAHLYARGAPAASEAFLDAFAWLSLGGAMRHELAHFDGAIEERDAYRIELDWYEDIRASEYLDSLDTETRKAWTWALDSAVLSVKRAALSASPR